MKHFILISLTVPTKRHQQYAEWLNEAEKLKRSAEAIKGIVALGESSWLIPRNESISFLAACVGVANMYEFPHRIWFLDEDA